MRPHSGQVLVITASTCKFSASMLCTSECFDRRADGKALALDVEVMTLDEVSMVYWKQSSHLTRSSLFWPGTMRGRSDPQASQKSKLPIATMLRVNVSFSNKFIGGEKDFLFLNRYSRKMRG